MATLTTPEVAQLLGIEQATVRTLVRRGHLTPLRRGARPLRFKEADVWELSASRRREDERVEARAAWERICEMIPA